MIKVTQQQRDNALEALNVMWPSVPPENVVPRLALWRGDESSAPPNCGTHACFGGWCAWWPNFRAQGVLCDGSGFPSVAATDARGASNFLFGACDLFKSRDWCEADDYFNGSDHELVSHRLRWLIANSKVIT